jgi:UDP-N-acetylmuramoylalanine--D-glutamate ligase
LKLQPGHITILGAGESGVGTAILALKEGWTVFVSDMGKVKPKFQAELDQLDVEWEQGKHSEEKVLSAQVIVKSPGIPDTVPLVLKAIEKGIPVISEIEFAAWYCNATKICVTGSNGKTTTAMLTHHILKNGGLKVGLAGNIGESYAKQVAEGKYDAYVLELSSFQLDGMFDFKADIAIILNITPDHLDRYENSMEKYADSKFRMLQNMTEKDHFIYYNEDEWIQKEIEKSNLICQQHPYSLDVMEGMTGYKTNKQITINFKQQLTMSIHDLALKGKHNTQNSLASGIAASILDIRKDSIRESLGDFENVEHRLEFVGKVHGIDFINDSKATNVNATWYALESMEKNTVWIVGGVDKGNDYSILDELVNDKVKAIICLGTDNQKLIESFDGKVEQILEARSAMEAVAYAYRLASKDETVLLSPACASFDLFENYEDRGDQFKSAVRSL